MILKNPFRITHDTRVRLGVILVAVIDIYSSYIVEVLANYIIPIHEMFKNINVQEHEMVKRGRGRPPKPSRRHSSMDDDDNDVDDDSNVGRQRQSQRGQPNRRPVRPSRPQKPPRKYSKKEMMELLADYIRIEDIAEIPLYSHVRYITLDKEGCQSFRIGGHVEQVSKRYVHIKSGKLKWYVPRYHYNVAEDPDRQSPIFETIFWKKRDQVDDIVDYLETQKSEIEFLKEQLALCKEILQILKEEHSATQESIETLKTQIIKCKDMHRRVMERVATLTSR